MNLLTILNEDFKQLSIEAKKKFPIIKEASDRAIVKLKSLGYESPDIVDLPKSDEVFNNLMSSIDVIIDSQATDNTTIQMQNKLLGIMISITQSLVSHKAFAEDTRIPIVIDKVYTLVDKARVLLNGENGSGSGVSLPIFSGNAGGENDFLNDENCVKISKLVVSLISTYTNLTGEYLLKSLKIAFMLSNLKNSKIVKSAACSSLMLIFTQVFGRARDAISKDDNKEENTKEESENKNEDVNEDKKEEEKKEDKKEDVSEDKNEVENEKKDEENNENKEDKKENDENKADDNNDEDDNDGKEEKENDKDEDKKEEIKDIKDTEESNKDEDKKEETEDKMEKEVPPVSKSPNPRSNDLTGILRDAYEILSDVCFLTSRSIFEEGIAALPTKRAPSKYIKVDKIDGLLGLDLISDILTNSYILFEKSDAFLNILKDDVCKFLILEKVKKILPISAAIGNNGTGLLSKLKNKNARLLGHEFRVYQRIFHICETLVVKDGYLVLIKSSSVYLFSIFEALDKVLVAENPNNANTFLYVMQILILELFDKIFAGKLDKPDYGCDAPTQPNSVSNLFFDKILKDILYFVQFKRKNPKKKAEIPLFKYEAYPFQNSKISLFEHMELNELPNDIIPGYKPSAAFKCLVDASALINTNVNYAEEGCFFANACDTLLEGFSRALRATKEVEVVEEVFTEYAKCIYSLAKLEGYEQDDLNNFMASLCGFCTVSDTENIEAAELVREKARFAFFKILRCFPNIFAGNNSKIWDIIVKTLKNLNMEFFGEKSTTLSDKVFVILVAALSKLSCEQLAGNAAFTTDPKTKKTSNFFLNVFLDVAAKNVPRLDVYWVPFSAHITEALKHESSVIRDHVLAMLASVAVHASTELYPIEPPAIPHDGEEVLPMESFLRNKTFFYPEDQEEKKPEEKSTENNEDNKPDEQRQEEKEKEGEIKEEDEKMTDEEDDDEKKEKKAEAETGREEEEKSILSTEDSKVWMFQCLILQYIESVMKSDSTIVEIRMELLNILHKIIQQVSDESRNTFNIDGWNGVLDVLFAAVQSGNPSLIQKSFLLAQCICSDHLQSLPYSREGQLQQQQQQQQQQEEKEEEEEKKDSNEEENKEGKKSDKLIERFDCLYKFIRLASAYTAQKKLLNISLSSVEMIWSVSSRVAVIAKSVPEKSADDETAEEVDPCLCERVYRLWCLLFNVEKANCIDERSEVRYSSICTFFRTLNTHASLFDSKTWEICLWEILFPLIDFIKARATAINGKNNDKKEGEDGEKKEGDKADENAKYSEMVAAVESSENTSSALGVVNGNEGSESSAMWVKTVVNSVESCSRLFKMTLDRLMRLDCFEEAWKKICTYTVDCTNEVPQPEVSEIAMTSSVMLLMRCAEPTAIPLSHTVWAATLDTFERVFRAVVSRDIYRTTPPILTAVVDDLTGFIERHAAFVADINENDSDKISSDVARIIDSVFPLALLPVDDYFDNNGISALQRSVFEFFAKVEASFGENTHVLEHILLKLAEYPVQASNPKIQRQVNDGTLAKVDERRLYTVLKVGCVGAERCAALFAKSFAKYPAVCTQTLPAIVKAFGDTMLVTRFAPTKLELLCEGFDELWKYSQRALIKTLVGGDEGGHGFEVICPGSDNAKAWEDIFAFFVSYFTKIAEVEEKEKEKEKEEEKEEEEKGKDEDDQSLDAELIAAATVDGVIKCGESVEGLDAKIAEILVAGCRAAAQSEKRILCKGFYHALFTAAAAPVSREALVDITLPLAYELSKEVITAYNADEESSADAVKLIAMETLLCELVDFKTKDAMFLAEKKEDGGEEGEKKSGAKALAGENPERSFLLLLLPMLFSSTLMDNTPQVSSYLKKILSIVGSEFLGL